MSRGEERGRGEALTLDCLALDKIEVVGSGENSRAESPHQTFQVAVVHVENILVHASQGSRASLAKRRGSRPRAGHSCGHMT